MNDQANERTSKRRPNTNQTLTHSQQCMGPFHEFSELCADDGIAIYIFEERLFWSISLYMPIVRLLLLLVLLRHYHQCCGTAVMLLFSHCLCVSVGCLCIFRDIFWPKIVVWEASFQKPIPTRACTDVKRVELLHALHMRTYHTMTDNASIVVVHFHSLS